MLRLIAVLALLSCSHPAAPQIASGDPPKAPASSPPASSLQAAPSLVCSSAPARPKEVPSDWVCVDAKRFTFFAPPEIQAVPVKGIDSFVGRYKLNDVDLSFDYGRYCSDLSEFKDYPAYQNKGGKIGGRAARLVTCEEYRPSEAEPPRWFAGVYVRDTGNGLGLTMTAACSSAAAQATAQKVLSTIAFLP